MRNISRTQPSAAHLSGVGSFLGQRKGAVPSNPTPAPAVSQNDAYRADYKPDFLSPSSPSTPTTQQNQPAQPRSISEQYRLARDQLKTPVPLAGNATEKQRRDYAWEVRADPMKAAEKVRQYERMYGPQPGQQQRSTPVRPTNFNGPRGRFGA